MGKKSKQNNMQHAPQEDAMPVKKKWHVKDLNKIVPKNQKQKNIIEGFRTAEKNFFLCGSAGTGKTFCALALALEKVLDPETPYEKVLIVRSVVPSRDMGFLPGSMEEKIALYEAPYVDMCDDLFEYKNSYKNLKDAGYIEFTSTSFLRGTTFKDAIVIVDEIQNMTFQEADTVMTRLGRNCRVFFAGDWRQNDLVQKKYDTSGFSDFYDIVKSMKKFFDIVEFDREDIVRSGIVKEYIVRKELLFGVNHD